MLRNPWTKACYAAHATKNILINQFDSPVIVLIYHRITTVISDSEMLAVTPENFRAQLRHLKDTIPFVRFEEDWAKATKPAVAITFDDGYADNVQEALPILEELGVPATFFISSGTIGTPREFWWHELERLLFGGRSLPCKFKLRDDRFGNEWPTATDTERQTFYQQLVRLMTDADTELRESWLSQLRQWAPSNEQTSDLHRTMTIDELRLLGASQWVTVGAHAVTHTRLASLPSNKQREEIMTSKSQIETWLGKKINVFSYPYGRHSDYTSETVALCREAGFTKAAANFPGQSHRWTDPFQIPRHLVRNWALDVFSEKLKRFWHS